MLHYIPHLVRGRGTRQAMPWLAGALGLFLIGTSAPAASALVDYPVMGGQMLRSVVSGAALLALTAFYLPGRAPRLTGRQLLWLAGLAVIGVAGFNVSVVVAVRHAEPAAVGAIIAVTPVLVALLVPVVQHRRPRFRVVVGCVVVAAGTAMVSGSGSLDVRGAALCGLALGCEVAFTVCAAALVPTLGGLRTTSYAIAASAPVLAVAAMITDGPRGMLRVPSVPEIAALAYLSAVIAVVANLAWYFTLGRIAADRASLCYAASPLGALAAAGAVAHAVPSVLQLVGVVLVAVGVMVGLAPPRRNRPEVEAGGPSPTVTEPPGIGPASS